MDFLNKYAPQTHGLLRIVAGLLFLEHGLDKVIGWPAAASATPHVFNIMAWPVGPAGVIETVARHPDPRRAVQPYAAFIASGEMAIAFWTAHFARGPFPILNGGGEAVLYCFIFLYLAAAGPGSFAVNQK